MFVDTSITATNSTATTFHGSLLLLSTNAYTNNIYTVPLPTST